MTLTERGKNPSKEPPRSFALTLARLEYLIARGLVTWDSVKNDSLVPDPDALVDRLSREREKFERLEITGFMAGDRFVIEGVRIQAKNAFQECIYGLSRELLSTKQPSEFTFKNNALSVRWA